MKVNALKTGGGNRGVGPLIRNLGTGWRKWLASCHGHYTVRDRAPTTDRRLGGPQR